MENGGIRNPKAVWMSNPGRLGLALALALCAAGLGYCASGKKGQAVMVATHPGAVRGCSFIGRVTGSSGEEGSMSTGSLSLRVAEMGGNVLLLLPAGSGEAWLCEQKTLAFGDAASPTPTRPVGGRAPTAPATPRT